MIRPERQEEMREFVEGVLLEFSTAQYSIEECEAITNAIGKELGQIRYLMTNNATLPKPPEPETEVKEAKPVTDKKAK